MGSLSLPHPQIGVGARRGVAIRIATAGALLLVLMWTALQPQRTTPSMNDHHIYALVLVALALTNAGHVLGLELIWDASSSSSDTKPCADTSQPHNQ